MSHYRRLSVNREDYRYVVGNETTYIQKMDGKGKFVAFSRVENSKLGQPYGADQYIVGPGNVARFIKGENPVKTYYCEEHDFSTTELETDPFTEEIHNRIILVSACPQCLQQSAWDI